MFDAAGLPAGATLNVYMGAGTLLSGGKAAGAITVPGSAAFTTPASALSATLSIADGVLQAGAPLEMVVRFSHAVSDVPTLAAASDSGTLGDNITNDASPALHGRGEAHARISIYKGTTSLGSTTAPATKAWPRAR